MEVSNKCKYPIVLVHGIILKDLKFFKAFGGIEKQLRLAGFSAYTAKTDGFGVIETNAEQLKNFVEEVKQKENTEKVNLVAHSKGGLDSKYAIENLGLADSVASLTTLCTPHKGSPVASYILRYPEPLLKFTAFWINFWYKIFGDQRPDSYAVCKQLKLDADKEPDDDFEFGEDIYCQSFSTTMEKSTDDFVMGIPLLISRKMNKVLEKADESTEVDATPSDGMVTTGSTKFGEYKGACMDGSVSHSQIVDFMAGAKQKERVYAFYIGLAEELARMGM